MPIISTDLVGYAALNRPEDDTSSSGGGVDVDTRATFTVMSANDTVQMSSDNAGDTTQNVTVTGRDDTGATISDTKQLNGTNTVVFAGTFERILKVAMDADAAGEVTIERTTGAVKIADIPVGERGFTRLFIGSSSETSQVIRYEKLCWRNNHATLTLGAAQVTLTSDPASRLRIGVESTKDDTVSVANRLTTPGGVTFVDNAVAQSLPGGQLEAGSYISVWIEQDLPADDPAQKATFNTQLLGTTI